MKDSQEVLLLYQRLGHSSLKIMQTLFLNVCKNINNNVLMCEPCEMVKHKHIIFPPSNISTSTLFKLIHSEVWGPFLVLSISGVY